MQFKTDADNNDFSYVPFRKQKWGMYIQELCYLNYEDEASEMVFA